MCVRSQESDDLFAGDTHADGAADGFPSDLPRDHVRVAGGEAGEELEDGNLQLRGCVSVDAVVGLDDNEAFAVGGAEGGVEAGRDAAEGAGVGGEGCGKARGVEARGRGGALVHDAEVAKVVEHLELGAGEGRFAVVLAKFEAPEHEEESEDVDGVHVSLGVWYLKLVFGVMGIRGKGSEGRSLTSAPASR